MNRSSRTSSLFLLFSTTVALACTPKPQVALSPTPVAKPLVSANDVKWSRNSAEYRAIFIQTYRAAAERLVTLAAGRLPGSWGVILDADETVLDNSEYEVGRIPFAGAFDAAIWAKWVAEGRAPALPGSVAFTNRVHELGGKVVIVTNRNEAQCAVTRQNLVQALIYTDLVLCKNAVSDKNTRFDAVQDGSAAPGFPALVILEWVGDNIQDFPHLNQSIREGSAAAFSRFGDSFFALPNPMYGSWESNPFK